MFRIILPIIDLPILSDLLFFITDTESPSITTNVNPICFPMKTAWRHARVSIANEEATSP
ncbi:hypothetical protein ERO13_A09G120925v2 [Gossypium hirsutum]|uniref:Uncharacterized protein n=2 Tax=Gossypium TaxID=3633 RepID=A0A5D2XXI0_GOSMU|nr:hypothetical protein ERO13_A09G120925v2 [Gossypium hirsutum]TYI10495.1 hypothetical protein ES332_A09G144900v1 [Gossypium tomentosum]TYJ18542.1 hypothetical protein E1A91_A09G130800v1 [Gossypium mustelinum]